MLLAPTLQMFFTTRLTSQFGASPHTLAAYRDTWRLLLRFIGDTRAVPPQDLDLSMITGEVISDFLTHLETGRGNAVTTRNARLAAVHAFFAYAAYHHPEHAATISQIMAIPSKRHHRTDVTYLRPPEVAPRVRFGSANQVTISTRGETRLPIGHAVLAGDLAVTEEESTLLGRAVAVKLVDSDFPRQASKLSDRWRPKSGTEPRCCRGRRHTRSRTQSRCECVAAKVSVCRPCG